MGGRLFVCSVFAFLFFWWLVASSFYAEAPEKQFENLRKIPEIEEAVILSDTYDATDDDGNLSNDFEIYLTGERFLKVRGMGEKLKVKYYNTGEFQLEAIGSFYFAAPFDMGTLSVLTGKKSRLCEALLKIMI